MQEAVSRLQNSWEKEEISKTINENFNLNNLNIGPPIAKGCAAVVYAAALKINSNVSSDKADTPGSTVQSSSQMESPIRHEALSPIQNTSRFLHNFGGSVDNLHFNHRDIDLNLSNRNYETFTRLRYDSINEISTEPLEPSFNALIESNSDNSMRENISENVSLFSF